MVATARRLLMMQGYGQRRAAFVNQITAISGAPPVRGWLAHRDDALTSVDPWNGTIWTADATMVAQLTPQGKGTLRAFASASSRYLTSADAANCSFGNATADSPFTLLWYGTITDTAAARVLLSKWNTAQSEYLFSLGTTDLLSMRIYTAASDAILHLRASDAAVPMGSPHLYWTTYDGSGGATGGNGIVVGVDGAAVASTPTNNAAYVAMNDKTAEVEIGSFIAHTSSFMDGAGGSGLIFAGQKSAAQMAAFAAAFSAYFGAP